MRTLRNLINTPGAQSLLRQALLIQTNINERVDSFIDKNPFVVTIVGGTIRGVRRVLGINQ